MQVWAIVVAAGSGTRYGAPKQFVTLGGQRLVDRAVAVAGRHAAGIVVSLPAGVAWDGDPAVHAVVGGPSRSDSVRSALAAVPEGADVIVVHDAARPLASDALFEATLAAVREGADGAVPALPLTDTVKRVAGVRVVETIERRDLVAVQTPQAFAAQVLRRAHAGHGEVTDDAALVERAGGIVVVVAGDPRNLKVTDASDLARAEALLDAEASA